MEMRQSFYYARRIFAAGELTKAFEALTRCLGEGSGETRFTIWESLADGTKITSRVELHGLDSVCDLAKQRVAMYCSREDGDVIVILDSGFKNAFYLSISAPTGKLIADARDVFQALLCLEPAPQEEKDVDPFASEIRKQLTEGLEPIVKRLDVLEQVASGSSRRLRCFLSFRFNDTAELVALRVQQFLTLLDVEVLTGVNYEPRQVSEKVLSKLRQPLDLIVLLITRDGESMWTRDEIGAAIHKGVALVPIIEKGAKLQPGLFADVEYVEFDSGHIGDAFLKLLQAVRFVREQEGGSPARTTEPPRRIAATGE